MDKKEEYTAHTDVIAVLPIAIKKDVLLAEIPQDANTLLVNVSIAENLKILMQDPLDINNTEVLL